LESQENATFWSNLAAAGHSCIGAAADSNMWKTIDDTAHDIRDEIA
jgi:hypothetical protein